jgi:uncharacterized integral membrane protein
MDLIKKWLLRIVIFIVFIAALIAASDNSQEVALGFLGYETAEWPVSWWVLTAFVLGVLFGLLLNFLSNTQLRLDARKASKEVSRTHKALDKERATAVSD